MPDRSAFERKLYVIRKRAEHTVRGSDLSERKYFYVPSLSANTLIYKGMLSADQIETMFPDVMDPLVESALALVHQRFSTNTFPSWPLAHPYRYIAHNGEINTLRGNINWMRAREALCRSRLLGDDLKRILPIVVEGGSDSAVFDNVLEFLVMAGRPLPLAVLMMIPEAWSGHESMEEERRAFYEYHGCLMEPWDGPASIAFTDGTVIGAVLDRNGLRPSRYYVTKDGMVVMASEVGVLDIPAERVLIKERLHPGRIFLVDTAQGRIIDDAELKHTYATQHPYGEWLKAYLKPIESLPEPPSVPEPDHETVLQRQLAFGYTHEDLRILLAPMAVNGEEPVGSMGTDTSLAVLSNRPRLLYDYFKQLFAQVTNPPLDGIREELVTQIATTIGPEGNLLEPTPDACRQLKLKTPILHNEELARIRHVNLPGFKATTVSMLFPVADGAVGLARAMAELCRQASQAVADGYSFLIMSDRGVDAEHAPIPALLATSGVHHHLIREGNRVRVGLIIETGEAREVHHMALLLGYGAGAINPYLAFETLDDMIRPGTAPRPRSRGRAQELRQGAQQGHPQGHLEDGDLHHPVVPGRPDLRGDRPRQGVRRPVLHLDGLAHRRGRASTWSRGRRSCGISGPSPTGRSGPPSSTGAASTSGAATGSITCSIPRRCSSSSTPRAAASTGCSRSTRRSSTPRTRTTRPSGGSSSSSGRGRRSRSTRWSRSRPSSVASPPGAMSYGSISLEAHETLAIAMNRMGGKSNTGEGGEDPARYQRDANGD